MPRVLITGASRGLGLELARQYAADGWEVEATCRRPARAAELAGIGSSIRVHPLDVCSGDSVAELRRQLDEPVDLLINNAGIMAGADVPRGEGQGFGRVDYGAWMRVLETNVLGPMRLAEAFADSLAASELKCLVTITSAMGSIAGNQGGYYAYRSSKAAVNCAMHGLSRDLAGRGIVVVVLHPGWVRTDMGGPGAALSAEESVSGMRRVIAGLDSSDSGRFYDYTGREIPW